MGRARQSLASQKGATSNLVDVTCDLSCNRADVVRAMVGAKTIELLQDQMKALNQLLDESLMVMDVQKNKRSYEHRSEIFWSYRHDLSVENEEFKC